MWVLHVIIYTLGHKWVWHVHSTSADIGDSSYFFPSSLHGHLTHSEDNSTILNTLTQASIYTHILASMNNTEWNKGDRASYRYKLLYLSVFPSLCPVLAAVTCEGMNALTTTLAGFSNRTSHHFSLTYKLYIDTFTYIFVFLPYGKELLSNGDIQLRRHAECKYWFSTRTENIRTEHVHIDSNTYTPFRFLLFDTQ